MNKVMIFVVVLLVGGGIWYGVTMLNTSTTPSAENGAMEQKTTGALTQNAVELKDFSFNPKTLNVKAGSTVTVTNNDLTGHSVTADDNSFDSGVLSQGESTTLTFDKPGTYGYHCSPHPNMTLTVTVE